MTLEEMARQGMFPPAFEDTADRPFVRGALYYAGRKIDAEILNDSPVVKYDAKKRPRHKGRGPVENFPRHLGARPKRQRRVRVPADEPVENSASTCGKPVENLCKKSRLGRLHK
jgi:hypothetical protein